jgi:two-component system sensor histidine kinase RpfC
MDHSRTEIVRSTAPSLLVLVAEGSRTDQMVLAKMLEQLGHQAQLVSNAEATLDALERCQFDLVLIDVDTYGIDGINTVKLYRFASLGQSHVPVVAVTANATPNVWARCQEAAMDGCLQKPIQPKQLSTTIDRLLGNHDSRKSSIGDRNR